tara:strand:+ start:433 stop:624 length:192 start_codon:yes stop_codon:yes gene_type:complete
MDMNQALTEIDGVLENHYLNVREFSEAEAKEFQLCIDKLHEILADYCRLKKQPLGRSVVDTPK